jgi:predicted RNA binding protein YcfA (HicA-like mRNA interferase family)
MPKIPVLKPMEIIRILKSLGFIEIRTKGSHIQFRKGNLLVTIPLHNKDLNRETLKSILRQARLTVDELITLL